MTFTEKVYSIVKQIPKGAVLTYKQVAMRAGKPKAYRVVGNILKKNFNPEIPCHRVVRSDGTAGGYNRGSVSKRRILRAEGVSML